MNHNSEATGEGELISINSPELFEKVFKEWYKPLCRAAFRLLHEEQATEDIVQEVFVKLWEHRASISFHYSIKSYLYKSVVNSSLNYLKRHQRSFHPDDATWEVIRGGTEDTEEKVFFNETEEKVNVALNILPPACKSVFILSRYEDMSNKEIAETLGISVKTVENQMTKALKLLKERLEPILKSLITIVLFIF